MKISRWVKGIIAVNLASFMLSSHLLYADFPYSTNFARTPPSIEPIPPAVPPPEALPAPALPPTAPSTSQLPLLLDVNISGKYLGRASVILDSTQLAGFSDGGFVPAAIPVAGEKFFNAGERATIQGTGSAINLAASAQVAGSSIKSSVTLIAADPSISDGMVHIPQAVLAYERLVVGATDTAFADPGSVVPTLDLAGLNAIATVLSSSGKGSQGRISYLFGPALIPQPGFIGTLSIEQPLPELGTLPLAPNTAYSHMPDFILTMKYGDGEMTGPNQDVYEEYWHLQWGMLARDLAFETATKSIDTSAFGWGLQLSGFCQIPVYRDCAPPDGVGFSVIYGEGIGHYINDLHSPGAGLGNDAILNGTDLEPLPVFTYYAGYLHNWNNSFQSTLAFSQVNLSSVPGQVSSAYHHGEYVITNLVYHKAIASKVVKNYVSGIEFLYGHKTELSDAAGQDFRGMFMIGMSN